MRLPCCVYIPVVCLRLRILFFEKIDEFSRNIWYLALEATQCCNFQFPTMSINNIDDAQTREVVVILAPINLGS